jgi:hypothetical protein
VNGQTFALIYRALERNTGSVGLASVPCASIKAVNPEIAALQQHQDPASDGADALNKQIAQDLATQIAAVGGDVSLANEASTFAPGKIGDPTAAGNTCDVADDKLGCINSQNLRVDDLSAAEIQAAGGAAGAGAAAGAAGNATSNSQADNSQADNSQADNSQSCNSQASNSQADNSQAGNAQAGNAQADASAGNAAADFGGCDPTIVFGTPSDGRKEDAFEAKDLQTFPHGSALNIAVISGFICSQIGNKCKVDAAAVQTCNDAAKAANGLKAQAAADAFNSALGL